MRCGAEGRRLLEAEQEASFCLAADCVLASVASVCMWCVCVSTLDTQCQMHFLP